MATITALGTGSGLDLEALVTKLMQAESTPLTAIQGKQSSVNTKISALGTLNSKLADLQTAAKALKLEIGKTALEKFATYSATFSTSGVASATMGSGTVSGDYTLNITALAKGQRFSSSAVSSADAAIGDIGDTLTFDFATPDANGNSRSKTITLDSTNNSLTGLRNSINAANMGVKATIVTGSSGPQLLLSGEEGVNNSITLSSATGTLSSLFTQTQAAQDAAFTLNGIPAESSTNKATVLDGVTLNLLQENASTTFTISADHTEKMTSALNDFIKAYNNANSSMKSLGDYNATTKVAGALQGNSLLRYAQGQTRSLLFNTTVGGTSAYQRLSDLGVAVGTDGSLSLNTTKLSSALAAAPNDVAALVSKIGDEFSTTIEKFVGISGTIKISTDSQNSMLTELSKRSDAIERRLDAIEARYRKQFSALDTLVSSLNSTSSYLTQHLTTLSSSSK